MYRLVDGNPYAAVPSLHGGYSLLVVLFVATLAWPDPVALVGHPARRGAANGAALMESAI